MTSLGAVLAERTAPRRYAASILTTFGGFAIVLAFIGVYATVSHVMGGRRREMAVRMTLGASPGRILRLALSNALVYALPGLVLGAAAGIVASRLLGRWLFGIGALDALTLAGAGAGVTLVVMLASPAPAIRAARLDPARVLRAE